MKNLILIIRNIILSFCLLCLIGCDFKEKSIQTDDYFIKIVNKGNIIEHSSYVLELNYKINENRTIFINLIDFDKTILNQKVFLNKDNSSKKVLLYPNLPSDLENCSLKIFRKNSTENQYLIDKIDSIFIEKYNKDLVDILPATKDYIRFKNLPLELMPNKEYVFFADYSITKMSKLFFITRLDKASKSTKIFEKKIFRGKGEEKIKFILPEDYLNSKMLRFSLHIRPVKSKLGQKNLIKNATIRILGD